MKRAREGRSPEFIAQMVKEAPRSIENADAIRAALKDGARPNRLLPLERQYRQRLVLARRKR